ncbi:hypothetical protein GCM10009809_26640 [Isoptericola hypogeus]|uniref:DUF4232 domain-containing protein n=1 Tax=Isoptericola hypogeus TaxID=300179 RepID=A0ABN2JJR5_9MICO
MTRFRAAVVVVVVAAVGLALALVWRATTGGLPGPVRDASTRAEQVPGVVDVETRHDTLGGWPDQAATTYVDWTVRLDPALSPADAQAAADAVAAAVRLPESLEGSTAGSLTIAAGAPGTGAADHDGTALSLRDPDDGAVALAYTVLAAGASAVDDTSVTVPDAAKLAGVAALLESATTFQPPSLLRTSDDAVVYDAGLVPRAATAELVADVAGRAGVVGVAFTWEQTSPSDLTVTTTARPGSPAATALATRLDGARRSAVVTPTSYTLVAGDGTATAGWVAGLEPPRTVPRTVPLPDAVEPWPADAGALDCTGSDLGLTLGAPDAALGSRYLAVRAQNVSGRPCAVEGVPSIAFLNADGDEQDDVLVTAAAPGVVPGRVVVPAGESLLATLEWDAMSTANDPDVTTALAVTPVPGADPVRLVPEVPGGAGTSGGPAGLDVLDGADVQVGPWAQAADGWS